MLSHDIADLSTGPYYESPKAWYEQLKLTLIKHKCTVGPMPDIHTHQGQDFIDYTGREEGRIFFTWYQMPSSRWEMVCYKC